MLDRDDKPERVRQPLLKRGRVGIFCQLLIAIGGGRHQLDQRVGLRAHVIEEFHLVGEADEVINAIDALVRDLPEAGQVILTTREAPALSMTRLVVDGAVFPLGNEDLRFSPEETRALRATLGGDASRDEQAEGWVAGILLGGAPRQLGVGGGTLLGTYVEREVLGRLNPIEQGWLEMRTTRPEEMAG